MEPLTSCRSRLRNGALVAALAIVGWAILAGGATSTALANSSFNCESRSTEGSTCLLVSGPNETMDEGEGDNYSKPLFELIFYKFNGGSSYTVIFKQIFKTYTAYYCYPSSFDGHIQIASALERDNLAGTQRAGCIA